VSNITLLQVKICLVKSTSNYWDILDEVLKNWSGGGEIPGRAQANIGRHLNNRGWSARQINLVSGARG
jgi:hypothetical protein